MADNIIRVNVTSNKTQRVSVTPGQVQNEIIARPDTSQYFSNLSKNWAISETIVNNEDYSSKHYAQEAKESAQNASNFENATRESYNSFLETSANAVIEIQGVKEETLTEIDNSKTNAVDSINTVKNNAVDSINSTKTTILNDIEFVADGEKQEIQELADNAKDDIKSTGFYMRDDKLYFINSEGEEQEFKSGGGGGLEIGDIGFTQTAIDETLGKRRILNGQVIIQDQYVEFTDKVKSSVALNPDLACTESEWQTAVTMSANGVCYKFVIDDNAGTIRLPKYPTYLDLSINTGAKTQTVSVYGNGMALGLANGTRTFGLTSKRTADNYLGGVGSSYGASMGSDTVDLTINATDFVVSGVTTDASKSGLTGKVTVPAVQSEKIKGTYFIQVATGAGTEDNIINEIELNNPYSLGDSKYSPIALNNLSWLKSEGQWNSKAVYPSYYEWLLKIYNGVETVEGVSVKLLTESYTDYDFVINTTDETFKLPLLNGGESLPSDKHEAVPTFTLDKVATYYPVFTAPTNGWYHITIMQTWAATLKLFRNNTQLTLEAFGIDPIPSGGLVYSLKVFCKKGDVIYAFKNDGTFQIQETSFVYAKGNGSLYFYVGETVQNANLINAGRIEEKVATLISDNMDIITSSGFPSSKYVDLTIGASGAIYDAPANGWFCLGFGHLDNADWVNYGVDVLDSSGKFLYNIQGTRSLNNQTDGVMMPIKSGHKLQVFYNSYNVNRFRFIYAEGDK